MSKRIHCDHCGKEIEKGARYMRLASGIAMQNDDNLAVDADEPDDICVRCLELNAASILANAWRTMQAWLDDEKPTRPTPPDPASNPGSQVSG